MHIGIVTPYAVPEFGACTRRVKSFTDYFLEKGHQVTVYAPERRNFTGIQGSVVRYKTTTELEHLIADTPFDAIIGTSPPITHDFFALIAAKKKKVPFIFDVRDPFTEFLLASKSMSPWSPKFIAYSAMEYVLHTFSDKVTAVTEYDVNRIRKKYNRKEKDAIFATNGTDFIFEKLSEQDRLTIRKKVSFTEKNVVLFYGGSLKDEGIDMLIEILIPLMRQKPELCLIITTPSDESAENNAMIEKMRTAISTQGLEKRMQIFVNIPDKDVLEFIRASDITINTLAESMIHGIPAKTYEYMACYKPIAAMGPKEGSLDILMHKYNIGFFTTNWKEFAGGLEKAIGQLTEFAKKGEYGRSVVMERFLRRKTNEIMLQLILELKKK